MKTTKSSFVDIKTVVREYIVKKLVCESCGYSFDITNENIGSNVYLFKKELDKAEIGINCPICQYYMYANITKRR